MPKVNQCNYKLLDPKTQKKRYCKNKKFTNECYCYIHYKFLYNDNALKIQKVYKGYYIRKKLKIYYKLPRDLQRKIVWHMNKDLYQRHYQSSISKIIYNRYKKFFNDYTFLHKYYFNKFERDINNDFLNDFISLLKLSIKYYPIIKISKIPSLSTVFAICYNLSIIIPYRGDDFELIKKYVILYNI